MKNWIIKAGLFKTVVLVAIFSITASLVITTTIYTLVGHEISRTSLLIAILAPAIISPIVSVYIVRLMIKHHEMEQQMRALAGRLERSNAAKSEFLANISHEIRTPLNGALSMVKLLEGTELDDEQRRYVEAINFSSETLLTLISDVLDLSMIEAQRLELEQTAFELRPMVENIFDLLQPKAQQRRNNLDYVLDDSLPSTLVGDPTRLRQVLFNLLGNAIKFTEGGTIRLTISQQETDSQRQLVTVLFQIHDTGIGIAEEVKPRLFSAFTQANSSINRRYGGSGLGLAICSHLIEAMGGEIGVDSREGEGSTFWFRTTLPYTEGPVESYQPAAEFGSDNTLAILLVEDDPINQLAESTLLRQQGHQVTIAHDGYCALQILDGNRSQVTPPFDLILMDIRMPGLDGMETTQRIRNMGAAIGSLPIIALTADVTMQNIEQCHKAGIDLVLPKPIRYDELQAAISALGPGD